MFLPPASLAVDNGRAPHSWRTLRGGWCYSPIRYSPIHRVLGSEPRGLRTHRRCGRSRPLRSAVVEYQAPSVAVWLQLCARTGLANGHSRHPVMQGSPPVHRTPRPCLRTTGQNWHGTLFPQGAMISRSNRLLGPETRPCVQSESHNYFRHFFEGGGVGSP